MARPRDVSFRIVARDFTRNAFRRIGRSVNALRSAFSRLNAVVVGVIGGAFVRIATSTARATREVEQFSDSLQLPIQVGRLFQLIFKNVGGDVNDAADAIGSLSSELSKIGTREGARVEEALRFFGATAEQIQGFQNAPIAAFRFLFDNIARFGRNTQASAFLDELFGEDTRRKLAAAAAEYGSLEGAIGALGDQIGTAEDLRAQADAAEKLAEAYEKLSQALTTLAVEGGAIDRLTELVNLLNEAARLGSRFFDSQANANLIDQAGSDLRALPGRTAGLAGAGIEFLVNALKGNTEAVNNNTKNVRFGP